MPLQGLIGVDPEYMAAMEKARAIGAQPVSPLESALAEANPPPKKAPVAGAPQPRPRLTDEQRSMAKTRGILSGLGRGMKTGGLLGGIAGALDEPGAREDQFTYENYLDDLLSREDLTPNQRQALMARRYAGESYSATSKPWWESGQSKRGAVKQVTTHRDDQSIDRLIYGNTGETVPGSEGDPYPRWKDTDEQTGTWTVKQKYLPDGMVQDYEYNNKTREWRDVGEPYPRTDPKAPTDAEQRHQLKERTAVMNARRWWADLDDSMKAKIRKQWLSGTFDWTVDDVTANNVMAMQATYLNENPADRLRFLAEFEGAGQGPGPLSEGTDKQQQLMDAIQAETRPLVR